MTARLDVQIMLLIALLSLFHNYYNKTTNLKVRYGIILGLTNRTSWNSRNLNNLEFLKLFQILVHSQWWI